LCRALQGNVFGQMCMDYFWLQKGWQQMNITESFITETVLGLAAENIIERGGMVVLPFTPHMLRLVLTHEPTLNEHCAIEHRATGNTSDLALCTTTCVLDKEKMASIFEKDLEWQETNYLTHGARAMEQHLKSVHLHAKVKTFLESMETEKVVVDSIRFIALKRKVSIR
jgi:hypothetical protein